MEVLAGLAQCFPSCSISLHSACYQQSKDLLSSLAHPSQAKETWAPLAPWAGGGPLCPSRPALGAHSGCTHLPPFPAVGSCGPCTSTSTWRAECSVVSIITLTLGEIPNGGLMSNSCPCATAKCFILCESGMPLYLYAHHGMWL